MPKLEQHNRHREPSEPWKVIQRLVRESNSDELHSLLEVLTPGEVARALTRLDEEDQHQLLVLLEPEEAADLVEELSDAQGSDIIEDLPRNTAAAIVDEMESHHRADMLGEMDQDDAEAILKEMDPDEASDARKLLEYDENTAGGIMVTEFVSYVQEKTVSEVLQDMRDNAARYADFGLQYAYVNSERGTLVGVVRPRDLVLSSSDKRLQEIMVVNPICVTADMPLDELTRFFDRFTFWVVPVTDDDGQILGLARRADAEEAIGEEHERALLRFSGIIGGEELRSMPLAERTARRFRWLGLNMILSILAASVILLHQETVNQFFYLVFFMPIICNMSGCSGNQAVAVSIRELTIGLIKPEDYLRVWVKEVSVGIVNGALLGLALALLGLVLPVGAPTLGVVVGAAFALNTVIAVSLGGLLPLLLRKFKLDPALGAPPILTTITDMCGFLLVLTFARAALDSGWLVPL